MAVIAVRHEVHTTPTGRKRARGHHLFRQLRSKKKRLRKKYGHYCSRCNRVHRTDNEMTPERAEDRLVRRLSAGIRKAEDQALMEMLIQWTITM